MKETRPVSTNNTAGDQLSELPPSAKLVYTVLKYEGPLTAQELQYKTRLSAATVCQATSRLETAEITTSEIDIHNPQTVVYTVTADSHRPTQTEE